MIRARTTLITAIHCAALVLTACGTGKPNVPARNQNTPPNFIVIIADDLGIETLASYEVGAHAAKTPNIDRLAAEGAQFDNFWSMPTCSPARAALLTGRYGFRTGVTSPIMSYSDQLPVPQPETPADANKELAFNPLGLVPSYQDMIFGPKPGMHVATTLSTDETSIADALKASPAHYATAAFGKWHLSDPDNNWLDHPNLMGFDHYSGLIHGDWWSYFAWQHVENGELRAEKGYLDKRTVADAAEWLSAHTDSPTFVWVALAAPHSPFHLPPADILSAETLDSLPPDAINENEIRPYYLAMTEGMDTLIGELINAIPDERIDNTYIFFLGDNGSPNEALVPPMPSNRGKGTAYQGGVAVPLIVWGPGVQPGSRNRQLVQIVDLFATIVELAGVSRQNSSLNNKAIDGISAAAYLRNPTAPTRREFVYSHGQLGSRVVEAIRDDRFKLIKQAGRPDELYDLENDPHEAFDLLSGVPTVSDQEHARRLTAELERLRGNPVPQDD